MSLDDKVEKYIQASTDETPEQAVLRLSKLSSIEYDQLRRDETTRLNIRASVLDKEVKLCQAENQPADDSVVTNDTPYHGEVNGDAVLNEVASLINKHMVLPKGASTAVTMWIVSTYVYDSFRIFPKLAVISPEKRCGKSTLLDILGGLTNRSLIQYLRQNIELKDEQLLRYTFF